MPNNYNNNFNNQKDDMDDFFAQFDKPVQGSTSAQSSSEYKHSTGTRSTIAKRSAASRSGGRAKSHTGKSRSRTGSRNDKNRRSAKAPKQPGGKKSVIQIVILVILALIMAVGIYVGIVLMSAPKIETSNIYDQLNQRSVMYDCNGKEIENLYMSDGNRTIVKYKDIPEDMVNAVVAIEDRKFWKHNGFNFTRMLGAIKDSVFGGGQISGTSTVTQQLARNVYLADIKSQRSLSRKITEAYYTIVLEKNLSKEQIMEAYLNTIYLGFNSYGIQAASQSYFSKNVQDMDILECASLAALPQSPDSYALIQVDYYNSGSSLPVISKADSVTYLFNGDISNGTDVISFSETWQTWALLQMKK